MVYSGSSVKKLVSVMKITQLSIVMTAGACAVIIAGMLVPAMAPWLARESLFEFTAREPRNRNPAEPGAAPNGDPAWQVGDSEVAERPPSVS
jgi:hypothetical protein